MTEGNVRPPATDERGISISTTNIDMLSRSIKPDDHANSDNVNLMKRRTIASEGISHDVTDLRGPSRTEKPSTYAARKTVAQGMMDIALLTSNANQLRNLIVHQRQDRFFFFVMCLIIVSLVLQISVGVCLIFKGRFDAKTAKKDKAAAARVNNQMMAAVFVITVINIFIAAFSIPEGNVIPLDPNANSTQLNN